MIKTTATGTYIESPADCHVVVFNNWLLSFCQILVKNVLRCILPTVKPVPQNDEYVCVKDDGINIYDEEQPAGAAADE